MSDRESVITHLQIIHTWASFARERDLNFFTAKHLEKITDWMDDALAMLEGKKAVEPIIASDEMGCVNFYVCPSCKIAIDYGDKYCRYCGRELKWEGSK